MTTKPITAARLSEIAALATDTPGAWWREDMSAAIPELLTEITRLQSELDHATAHEGDHLSKASRRMVDTVMGDRDALLAEVARLRTDLGETQLVIEQQDRDLERLHGELAKLRPPSPTCRICGNPNCDGGT